VRSAGSCRDSDFSSSPGAIDVLAPNAADDRFSAEPVLSGAQQINRSFSGVAQ
jgi:hypothetical protein